MRGIVSAFILDDFKGKAAIFLKFFGQFGDALVVFVVIPHCRNRLVGCVRFFQQIENVHHHFYAAGVEIQQVQFKTYRQFVLQTLFDSTPVKA